MNASTSGSVPKKNLLKFLTLHSPFFLLIRKNTRIEWPSWVLYSLLLLMKPSDALQNGSLQHKTQNLELANLKCVRTTHSSVLKASVYLCSEKTSKNVNIWNAFVSIITGVNHSWKKILLLQFYESACAIYHIWVNVLPSLESSWNEMKWTHTNPKLMKMLQSKNILKKCLRLISQNFRLIS